MLSFALLAILTKAPIGANLCLARFAVGWSGRIGGTLLLSFTSVAGNARCATIQFKGRKIEADRLSCPIASYAVTPSHRSERPLATARKPANKKLTSGAAEYGVSKTAFAIDDASSA
jgi:hypothetical protein